MRPGLVPRGHGGSGDTGFVLQPGAPHSQYLGLPLAVAFMQLQPSPQQCRVQLQSGRGHALGPGRMFLPITQWIENSHRHALNNILSYPS